MKIELSNEQTMFLNETCTTIKTPQGDVYMYLPFWYKKTDVDNVFEELPFGELSDDLKEALNDDREKVKEIPPHLDKKPWTPDECSPKTKISSRQTGRTEAMIQGMVHRFKNNEYIGIAGCKDPDRILKRLAELGVKAEATVMSYWWEAPDGSMLPNKEIYTGYLFKVKPVREVKCFECGEVIDPNWIKGDATLISCEKCIKKYLEIRLSDAEMDVDKVNVIIDDVPDFDINKTYLVGDNAKYGGSVWVFVSHYDYTASTTGIYPGTGNGWKIKK